MIKTKLGRGGRRKRNRRKTWTRKTRPDRDPLGRIVRAR